MIIRYRSDLLRRAAAGMLALACIPALVAEANAAHFALAGDSTIAPNDGNDGWGDALSQFLERGDTVSNRGANGRSTKTFINEGRWQSVLDLDPDYILIQFGHNDQKVDQPALGTHAVDNPQTPPPPRGRGDGGPASDLFRVNLRRMVDDTRAIGAVPVLITPVARRGTPYNSVQAQIDRNNQVLSSDNLGNGYSLHDYADATKAVGLEKNVAVIDLNQLSLDLYAEMISRGENLGNLGPDATHFSRTGMVPIAELVGKALPAAIAPEPAAGTLCLLSLLATGVRPRSRR